jgi:hypothetical protein
MAAYLQHRDAAIAVRLAERQAMLPPGDPEVECNPMLTIEEGE